MTFRFSLAFALPLLLASGGAITLPAGPAMALSNDPVCVVTTYYNNADHDQVVGTRTHCSGGSSGTNTGRTSPYHDQEIIHTGNAGPAGGNHGGGLQLPCEFTTSPDCGNLPGNRYVTLGLKVSPGFGHGPKAGLGGQQLQLKSVQRLR